MAKTKATFTGRCEKAAETCGLIGDPYFFEARTKETSVCEDDGSLIVCVGGTCCAFNTGNNGDLPGKEQNENIRAVLTALRMKRFIAKALVDEHDCDEEDEEYCPHCGR